MKFQSFVGVGCAALVAHSCFAQLMVPNGTKLSCRLEQAVTSATAEEGQPVQLTTTENVKVGDSIVIPQGSPVQGTIVTAQEKRRMGRTGKLDFSIDKVRAADGDYIPLRYTMQKKQGGSSAVSTGVMTAGAAVLFWPAAPFFLLRKGKDVTINKGMIFEVFTDQDHVVKAVAAGSLPGAPTTPVPGAAPAPAAMAQPQMAEVKITSDIPGAEIEVDGAFVGSTPTTLQMKPGMHSITVKQGSAVWSRNLSVQSGEITVNAILTNAAPARRAPPK